MKQLILIYSYHHNNTQKIADVMGNVLNAEVKSILDLDSINLDEYQVIGFGAGIDSGHHYKQLLDYASNLDNVDKSKCFIFSTSAVQGEKKVFKDHLQLRNILTNKGYDIVDEFSCKGFNTNLFLKYFGGMNKDRPNQDDFDNAANFAKRIKKQFS